MKGTRLVLLILLLLLSCSLASCKPKAEEPPITEIPVQEVPEKLGPKIVMSTQYYDSIGNYIEVPALVMPDGGEPNEAIRAINLALAEIQEQYQVIPDVVASNQQCIFYPTETDRYINLLLFQTRFFTDLNTGHTVSFVYDKEENRQVTTEDALALVGLTEQDLFHALSAQYDPGYAQNYPSANICVQNHALEAFRLDSTGQPIFYLTARTDDADDTVQDAVSGADHLYIWANGVFTIYEQYNIGGEYSEGRIYPLISAEETVTMDPPLWNQWYFSGDEPDGGFTVIPIPERAPSDELLTYDIGKTLSELKNEHPEGKFIVSLDGFPDSAAACFGQQGAEYVYFFFGGHDGDFEKAMNECEEQLKCAGFITTANILFTDMEDDMSFQDFFSLIGVDEYEYLLGEEVTTGEGWLRFTYNGMEVMVNTNEVTAGGGWNFTGAEVVKRNAPVSIVDPEILNTNQDLAEAVMFDQFDTSEKTVTMETPLWNQWYFSDDEPDGGFTAIPSPERTQFDEPLTYLREKLNTLAPNTPLVVDDIWEFNWNGTDAIVVHATNVEITGDESTLYNPGGNHVAPNPPGTDNTVMYTMTTLFVDGCDPVELYYWAYPISSDPGGVSYLPATSGSFQQLYTVTQYAANGQPISCPVFMDHGGELIVRYFKYSPTYFQKDINADGIAEFIFSLDRDNSLMSHYQAYQMIDGAPKFIAITSPLYESVLLGTGEFYLDGNATTLKDYSSYTGADGNTHYRRPEEFCILDLDGDGRTEVVVAINDNQLSLILRESYGTVYGYVCPIRHFNTLTLKQDGTFGWSSSAFHHGIGRMDFSDGTDTVQHITYCDFSENADGSKNEICVVDGERVTYEEYSVAISAENNKPDATWYKLSEENVGLFFD